MYNIVTKKKTDPTIEFSGVWYNEQSGSIWIWGNEPILIGFAKEGKMIRADVYSAEFVYEEKRNKQKYSYDFEYSGLPTLVMAEVSKDNFFGGEVVIYFGDEYGRVSSDGKFLIAQNGNIKLGEKLTIKCVPTKGSLHIELTVLSYE